MGGGWGACGAGSGRKERGEGEWGSNGVPLRPTHLLVLLLHLTLPLAHLLISVLLVLHEVPQQVLLHHQGLPQAEFTHCDGMGESGRYRWSNNATAVP